MVTLFEAIEGIPDKDYNFWGNENFHNIYERLLYERKRKSGYLERRRIYERPLHLHERVNLLENQSDHISKLSLRQSLVKRKFIYCDF